MIRSGGACFRDEKGFGTMKSRLLWKAGRCVAPIILVMAMSAVGASIAATFIALLLVLFGLPLLNFGYRHTRRQSGNCDHRSHGRAARTDPITNYLAAFLITGIGIVDGRCQSPNIPPQQWERAFGGSGPDTISDIRALADGDFLLAGWSASITDGLKTASLYGGADFWLIRIDRHGNSKWDQAFGGTGDDVLASLELSEGDGFILGGFSTSDANGSKKSPNRGGADFWVVRVSSDGEQLWDQSFGGTEGDILRDLRQTRDGGFVLVGESYSQANGNKTSPNRGGGDFWMVRIDAEGNKLWDRTFGGTANEFLWSVLETSDGGFLLGGWSSSSNNYGTRTSALLGGNDFWIVRTDSNGNQLWDRSFGGTGDDYILTLCQTPDGGFAAGGGSTSVNNGNKSSPNFGGIDYWIVRMDGAGTKLWDRSFGGTGNDELFALKPAADGGFVLAGRSDSAANGNKTSANLGGDDAWIIGLDSSGNKIWEQAFGGSGDDRALSLTVTDDEGFLFGGLSTSSPTGTKKAPNFGFSDFWTMKFGYDLPALEISRQPVNSIRQQGFRLILHGQAGVSYRIEASRDLTTWSTLTKARLTETTAEIFDPAGKTASWGFYRVSRE